jgi:molybdopterin adenylyltransferase
MTVAPAKIGILVASDRASSGDYEDRGGTAIESYLRAVLASPWESIYRLVPDDRSRIAATLRNLVDTMAANLILTTGGTGPAMRDVTPEATTDICDRLLPGFGEEMRRASLRQVPTAILSRQIAGTRGRCVIINLPGKPGSIETCLDAVFPAIPYCIELVGGPRLETNPERCAAFRPAS